MSTLVGPDTAVVEAGRSPRKCSIVPLVKFKEANVLPDILPATKGEDPAGSVLNFTALVEHPSVAATC